MQTAEEFEEFEIDWDSVVEPPDPETPANDTAEVSALVAVTPALGPWHIEPTRLSRGDHAELGDLLLDILCQQYSDLVCVADLLYGYRGGVFEVIGAAEVERIVKGFAGPVTVGDDDKSHQLHVSAGTLSGTIKLARTEVRDDSFFESAPAGIAFTDGFVGVSETGLSLSAHSPEHRARYRYGFSFGGSDEPAKFFGYLNDVFRDDADKDDKIAAVQEFMGAAISGIATDFERALVLFGPGANGKTRLAEIIRATMPPGSVTALPPGLWNDQYQRPLLNGARLNVVPDLTDDALGPAVKGIISGEGVAARSPGAAAIAFCPKAAHVFGCNELPQTKDATAGFFRRWLIIPMTRSFANDPQRDTQIHAKIIASDTPEIVRWALKGAVRLMRHNEYTLPASHALMIARWRGKTDNVRLFVETRTRRAEGTERGMPAAELHRAYADWAKVQGIPPETPKAFGTALANMGVFGKNASAGKLWGLVVLD